jgi:glyoxylase-like metal-dependent hydrolase (beta-lactamase superfamily II)
VDNFVNILAFTGPEGALLVDTGFEETAAEVLSILEERSGGNISIKYIINTHSDYDHIAGNPALRQGAIILSHANCKAQLIRYAEPEYDIPFDKEIFRNALPTLAFEEPLTLYFNGEEIEIIPLIGGHTDEDSIVYFKNAGVAYLGDMVSIDTFPVVKLDNGGNAKRLVKNIEKLMELLPEDTRLVVGHGRDTTTKELHNYHIMLVSTIKVVDEALKEGMSVEEMISENILKDWMSYHEPKYDETKAETWIKSIYHSLVDSTNLRGV